MSAAGRHAYLFDAGVGDPHLLIVDGSQVFGVSPQMSLQIAAAADCGDAVVQGLLATHGLGVDRFVGTETPDEPPIRALSLAVAQRCNLGCTYCYAEGGSFGSPVGSMPREVARTSVHRLLSEAERGSRVNLAFMGGEPLVNRPVIREATELAAQLAAAKGVSIGFSITTNGTLLTTEDADFLERFGFSVTISLDGVGAVHDRLRPTKGGGGSYERIVANIRRLLARRRRCQVSARVTVTPANLGLRETLDHFVALGFDSVGFAPMLRAPSGRDEMDGPDLDVMLAEMIDCGREFERRTIAGETYAFSNITTALDEIHRGTHRPYPCGAGAGYLGVSAEGGLFACHRFVGDERFSMGDVAAGVNRTRQARWLGERAVDRQDPCRACWARYLCGGGCHYEAIHRGRPACDYIRGWLDYALGAYVRLSSARPELFSERRSVTRSQMARRSADLV